MNHSLIHCATTRPRSLRCFLLAGLLLGFAWQPGVAQEASPQFSWPEPTKETRPWSYWWWMASAVDEANIVRELTRYRDAGMGGVHIIPIYGAKGWEDKYIPYLSPRWMEMLAFTVGEARKLGLDVDMTTGTGWCFGGPQVSDEEANASVVWKAYDLAAGEKLDATFDRNKTQALIAFGPGGETQDLTRKLDAEGKVNWSPKEGAWKVYSVSQKPQGQKVKRPAPGGEGHMLNLFYEPAMKNYLKWMDAAFKDYSRPKPRAQYHDSYEYKSEWSPDLFRQFERRRGYRLQDHLDALFTGQPADRAARVKSDYRETASDVMAEVTLPMWASWSKKNGFLTRNEAHGSPGNWLDCYAVADMPETEMFYRDRNKLVSKFASSAAHVAGRKRTSCETGTWLKEHFTETLADMKYLLDDLFLSGVNHILYHGTCYSPDEVSWPGWLFYASYEMNPRNSVWHDVPALNAYATRCQAVLQDGQPDNNILLYWPLHDYWHDASGMIRNMTVHGREWFEDQPIGHLAQKLWDQGHAFDYISDRQLAKAKASATGVKVTGGEYKVVVVPKVEHMPLDTFEKLLSMARAGATIVFEDQLPPDVPGWHELDKRRAELGKLKSKLQAEADGVIKTGNGKLIVGNVAMALTLSGVKRESMFDHPGLMCIRRTVAGGHYYFVANRGDQAFEDWVTLARPAASVILFDPLSGVSGIGRVRLQADQTETLLQLQPGESVILRTFTDSEVDGERWNYFKPVGASQEIAGEWKVEFVSGGPELPPSFTTGTLSSWTGQGGEAERFAGTARYTLTFDLPKPLLVPGDSPGRAATGEGRPYPTGRDAANADPLKLALETWQLDLGQVCQSARVRLNGKELGTLITPPFRVSVHGLRPGGNLLEIEVTNVSANRIRDLDRRGVKWQNFHDINFVNLNYRPFNAANWPLTDSGLLGPVTLTALTSFLLSGE